MYKENFNLFSDKRILITGGTGSFGKTICKHFLELGINELRIFSRDEKKQDEMRQDFLDDRLSFYIGDIRDYDSIYEACNNVDYIFHAAALKQVPSCEFYPIEAVKTNIIGTENLLKSAIRNGIQKVVLLSTDKAVYPINSMGLTKAMMEKLMLSKSLIAQESHTIFCATRYGNVIGSRGSVIPLFINQIKRNKEITITNPNMTRFMMTLEDAVELVFYAFKEASKGDIFIQKAPACSILNLVDALKDLFSYNQPINIIGTRHGEKLYESLVSKEEKARALDMGKYFRIPPDNRDLNYNKYFIEGNMEIINRILNKDFTPIISNIKKLSNENLIFFYPASLYEHKNHRNLFEAIKLLERNSIKKFKLILTIKESDLEIFSIKNRSNILCIGEVEYLDLLKIYKFVDFLLFPSISESLGLPLLEAKQNNIKIIASNLEYVFDICNPAFVFNPYDSKEIYEKLNIVLKGSKKS